MPSPAAVQAFQCAAPDFSSPNRKCSDQSIDAVASNRRIIWCIIIAMAIGTIVAYRLAHFSFAWSSSPVLLTTLLILLAVSSFGRRFWPGHWITFSAESCTQLVLVLSLGCAISFPLAATGFPYRDAALNAVDTWMGLDWRAYLHFINERPLLGAWTGFAYRSMLFQFLILIVGLAVTSRRLQLQQYIFATALALAVTLAVFVFVPAGGIYTFLKIRPDEFANLSPIMTTDQIIRLDALRSAKHTLVSEMAGLVTFPSFHAVWAILFMWGFYPIKQLRFGAFFLNLFVIASTPIQGAHYFVDLIGGAVVVAIAIYAAVRLMPAVRLQTATTPTPPEPQPQNNREIRDSGSTIADMRGSVTIKGDAARGRHQSDRAAAANRKRSCLVPLRRPITSATG